MQQAVSLLARREHSSRELRDKLRARSFSAEAVEEALATLRQKNLQSDQRFAEACARSLMDRGYGSLRVAGELHERGVSGDIAQKFESLAREGEFERACEVIAPKDGDTAATAAFPEPAGISRRGRETGSRCGTSGESR